MMDLHYQGVKCAECDDVLEPDDCCPANPHGFRLAEWNGYAQLTWKAHLHVI